MVPHFAFLPRVQGELEGLLIYLLTCAFMISGTEHYRKLTKRLKNEEHFRKIAIEELAHRLKNKIATIQSIIGYQLRDSPETKDAIISRLAALSSTDDLIMAAQGRGAHLRDILSAE